MKKTLKRLSSLLLTGALLAAMLTACGDSESAPSGTTPSSDTALNEAAVLPFSEVDFSQHDLTLVNAFATWCSPCVKEIPELDQLSRNMSDRGVQVIGIVLDTVDYSGALNLDAVADAETLIERTGASYPMYLSDNEAFGGALPTITSVPTTFFVNSAGEIVGQVYVGARDLDSWTAIVEDELSALEAAA